MKKKNKYVSLLKKKPYWLRCESILKELDLQTEDFIQYITEAIQEQYIVEVLQELFKHEPIDDFQPPLLDACWRFTEIHLVTKDRCQEKQISFKEQYGVDWQRSYVKWVVEECYLSDNAKVQEKEVEIEEEKKKFVSKGVMGEMEDVNKVQRLSVQAKDALEELSLLKKKGKL